MIGGDPARCINLSCGVGPPRLGRRAENKARAGVEGKGGPSVVSIDGVGLLEKEGRRRMVERGRREIFIPRESGGGPVRAPCPKRRVAKSGGANRSTEIILISVSINNSKKELIKNIRE
jgi:hypothetical protein